MNLSKPISGQDTVLSHLNPSSLTAHHQPPPPINQPHILPAFLCPSSKLTCNFEFMLQSSNLTFSYPNGTSFSFPDVFCEEKGHLLLLGESGQGKTTLLHLLAGMLRPSAGSVGINGTDIAQLDRKAMDTFRGQHIGIVFQTAHFVESLSVEDNLILPQYLAGKTIDRNKAQLIIGRLNLTQKLHEKTRNLSVGEQQRVAIARSLMNDPAIVLADEPTSALDDRNAEEVISLLEEQAALSGAGLIIVTHDQRLKDRFEKSVVL